LFCIVHCLSASSTGDAAVLAPDGGGVALVHADAPSPTDATIMNSLDSLFI
jgi:hypothetical protein